MTQVVYGLISDNGYGSSSISWFKDKRVVDFILGDDYEYNESYYANESEPSVILTLPDDLDLKSAGFDLEDEYFLDEYKDFFE